MMFWLTLTWFRLSQDLRPLRKTLAASRAKALALGDMPSAIATDTAAAKEAKLSFKNDRRHRVMLGMAESDEGGSYAALCGKLLRWPRENEKRLATWFFLNVDIAPAHRLANPGAECF